MTSKDIDEQPTAAEPGAEAPDLRSFAVELRRMTGEVNALVHGFAAAQHLHPTDVQALAAVLDADSPMTPTKLRQRLGLTSGAVTACLDRLERAGHVTRVRDSRDRRVVHVRYLAPARLVAREHFLPLAEATRRALRQFSPEEQDLALRFLGALNEELGRVSED
ncbi:MarR family winged helix-turn-helix transcriptional regulator [Streptomyces sp. NPDC001941]|uniref:MarR family winged helix-turn-helix transcriptional regulator n=1 Tax=Streptomyces sp. NPDC001941 TaxID=3154659 RepID=UPI00332A9CF5